MKNLFVAVLFTAIPLYFTGCISDDENPQKEIDNAFDDSETVDGETIESEPDEMITEEPDEVTDEIEDEDIDKDVEPPFNVDIVPSSDFVYEYGAVSFAAEISGGTPPYFYEWSFDDAAPESTEENPGDILFTDPGQYKISLIVRDTDDKTTDDEIIFTVQPLEGNMNFYFGNLHSHSGVSDGEGTPSEVMEWAKNHEKLDFYIMTDHAEQILDYEWNAIKTQTDTASQDGVFISMRGFEWSHPVNGHICVYETEKYTAAYDSLWISDFYDWIEENDGMGQFNHPGREIEAFNNLKLETNVINHMFAMETGNKSTGNNDGEFISYFIKALDNGWQIAPTSNQDNHKLEMNSHRTVYTGEELTRDHLLNAMRSRRLYSSDDPDIRIVFKHEEAWMGSHVTPPSDKIRFSIKVVDNEPVQKLELITYKGEIAAEMVPETEEDDDGMITVFWFPEITVTQNTYFFLKVTSEDIFDDDGPVQIALTAPIWIYR